MALLLESMRRSYVFPSHRTTHYQYNRVKTYLNYSGHGAASTTLQTLFESEVLNNDAVCGSQDAALHDLDWRTCSREVVAILERIYIAKLLVAILVTAFSPVYHLLLEATFSCIHDNDTAAIRRTREEAQRHGLYVLGSPPDSPLQCFMWLEPALVFGITMPVLLPLAAVQLYVDTLRFHWLATSALPMQVPSAKSQGHSAQFRKVQLYLTAGTILVLEGIVVVLFFVGNGFQGDVAAATLVPFINMCSFVVMLTSPTVDKGSIGVGAWDLAAGVARRLEKIQQAHESLVHDSSSSNAPEASAPRRKNGLGTVLSFPLHHREPHTPMGMPESPCKNPVLDTGVVSSGSVGGGPGPKDVEMMARGDLDWHHDGS